MTGLRDVPTELVVHIASQLSDCRDLAALAASSRQLYSVVNAELYKRMSPADFGRMLEEICRKPAWATATDSKSESVRLRLINRLLELGADVDHPDEDGSTSLMHVASWHDLRLMDAFIKAGANPQRQNRLGSTPLLEACQGCLEEEDGKEIKAFTAAIGRLLDAGAEVDFVLRDGNTVLMTICEDTDEFDEFDLANGTIHSTRGRLAAVAHLLKHGADPNCTGNYTQPPIYFAFLARRLDLCELLLKHGAQVTDELATSLVSSAIEISWVDGFKFVSKLAKDVCANYCAEHDFFGLLESAIRAPLEAQWDDDDVYPGNVDLLAGLLDLGLEPIDNSSGATLLHAVCELPESIPCALGRHVWAFEHAVAVCKYLIDQRGFDARARNNAGETPLDIAKRAGNDELVDTLREYAGKEAKIRPYSRSNPRRR